MGLFGFLKKNPAAVLEKARQELTEGSGRAALNRLDRLLAEGGDEVREAALELRYEAREAVIATALERADQAEEAGYLDDAAQWVESAHELLRDAGSDGQPDKRATALEIRLATLRQRAEAEQEAAAAETFDLGPGVESAAFHEIDPDALYEILCEMNSEAVAPRYRGRGGTFRHAVVDLNDGKGEEALRALEFLVAEAREAGEEPDAVVYLERGRARMLTGAPQGAREDFSRAWEEIGDEPLDQSGELSVPSLWAAAALETGDAATVAQRLAPLADPATASPSLIEFYGTALEKLERFEEARDLWWNAVGYYPKKILFSRHLATVLAQLGDPRQAIHCLESAIAPSCRSGNCSAPAKDLTTFRQLVALYLDPATLDTQRAGELLEQISLEQRGLLARPDLELNATYYRAIEDFEAASEMESLLEQLATDEVGLADEADLAAPDLTDQKRAAL